MEGYMACWLKEVLKPHSILGFLIVDLRSLYSSLQDVGVMFLSAVAIGWSTFILTVTDMRLFGIVDKHVFCFWQIDFWVEPSSVVCGFQRSIQISPTAVALSFSSWNLSQLPGLLQMFKISRSVRTRSLSLEIELRKMLSKFAQNRWGQTSASM